jgi:hypothetical protein
MPMQFQHMTSEFDVAKWLANHSRILNLALAIRNAKLMPITNEESSQSLQGLQGLQGSQGIQVIQQDSQVEITQVISLLYIIYLKTLFTIVLTTFFIFIFSIRNSSCKKNLRHFSCEPEIIHKIFIWS